MPALKARRTPLLPVAAFLFLAVSLAAVPKRVTAQLPSARAPATAAASPDPVVTMFPHPEGRRYWLSGQANIIFQGRLPFHAPYEGPNSFRNSAEYKTSLVGTLYAALRPTRVHPLQHRPDPRCRIRRRPRPQRSAGSGRIHQSRRRPQPQPGQHAVSRPLPDSSGHRPHREDDAPRHPNFFALATEVPVRRIEFRVGKMTLPDFFDLNEIGSDCHLQFMNWTVDNNGAWDYAADTRGYTVGGMAEYDDRNWTSATASSPCPSSPTASTSTGPSAALTDRTANSSCASRLLSRPQRHIAPALLRQSRAYGHLPRGGQRLSRRHRCHSRHHRARAFRRAQIRLRLQHPAGSHDNLRVFGRFGWNEGQHESFAYTEVDQTMEAGGDYAMRRFGIARRQNRPRSRFQRHQARPSELSETTAASASC